MFGHPCLMVFGHQTFLVYTGFKQKAHSFPFVCKDWLEITWKLLNNRYPLQNFFGLKVRFLDREVRYDWAK